MLESVTSIKFTRQRIQESDEIFSGRIQFAN